MGNDGNETPFVPTVRNVPIVLFVPTVPTVGNVPIVLFVPAVRIVPIVPNVPFVPYRKNVPIVLFVPTVPTVGNVPIVLFVPAVRIVPIVPNVPFVPYRKNVPIVSFVSGVPESTPLSHRPLTGHCDSSPAGEPSVPPSNPVNFAVRRGCEQVCLTTSWPPPTGVFLPPPWGRWRGASAP